MNFSRRHLILGSLALPALAAKKTGETPNIVLILVDRLPAWVLGCYGNKEVLTPNFDRLAQTGTRFATHLAGSARPAEAQTALMTGTATGSSVSLDKILAGAGYATQSSGGSAEAVKYIDSQAGGKPFFTSISLTGFAPPYANASKFLDRYPSGKFDSFEQTPPAANIAAHKEMFGAGLSGNLRKAASSVTAIDEEIGTILTALGRKKLLDNTLVIVTSPTGSLVGRHGLWGGSEGSAPPNFYEEVVATPMIWTWPARVLPAAVRPEVTSAFDLVPTLCDLTPADMPAVKSPGRSYLPLLQGKPLPKKEPWRRTAFLWESDSGVARNDRYKLVLRGGGKGPNELYDLKADARERVNQFDNPQFLTVKTELTGELTRWRENYAA